MFKLPARIKRHSRNGHWKPRFFLASACTFVFWYDIEARSLALREDHEPPHLRIIAKALTVQYKRDIYARREMRKKRTAPLAST